MSELKVHVKPLKTNVLGQTIVGQSYYLKSEADKVIAELKQKINEAQTELELWRDGSIISEAHQKELDGKRHSDYKRCLAMADKCVDLCHKAKDLYRWAEDENLEHYYNHKIEFFARWQKRWLELAEKLRFVRCMQRRKK